MKTIVLMSSVLLFSGCAVMTSKQFQKQQELWQSIGRVTGIAECQQSVAEQLLRIQGKQVKENQNAK